MGNDKEAPIAEAEAAIRGLRAVCAVCAVCAVSGGRLRSIRFQFGLLLLVVCLMCRKESHYALRKRA